MSLISEQFHPVPALLLGKALHFIVRWSCQWIPKQSAEDAASTITRPEADSGTSLAKLQGRDSACPWYQRSRWETETPRCRCPATHVSTVRGGCWASPRFCPQSIDIYSAIHLDSQNHKSRGVFFRPVHQQHLIRKYTWMLWEKDCLLHVANHCNNQPRLSMRLFRLGKGRNWGPCQQSRLMTLKIDFCVLSFTWIIPVSKWLITMVRKSPK